MSHFNRTSKIFIIICCLKLATSSCCSDTQAVSTAISNICEEFFVKKSIKFDIIIYGESTHHLSDVVDGILQFSTEIFTISIKQIKDIYKWKHVIEDSAVILVENAQILKNFNSFVQFISTTPKIPKLIIYCADLSDSDVIPMQKNFSIDKFHISAIEYFIINENSTIELRTAEYFSKSSCNEFMFELLNFFNKTTWKWNEILLSYEKFENFNECTLTLMTQYSTYFHFNKYNRKIRKCSMSQMNQSYCI